MAMFQCHFKSRVQDMHSSFNVIIPEQCIDDIPVVYLLHGLAGDENNWPRFTAIERYATERNLAVVMPGVGKHFYSDVREGSMDYSYIVDELIAYCCRIFPLSKKREKTFIAGLSMGGYGAFKIAFGQSERFAACASLSGVVDLCHRVVQEDFFEVSRNTWGENFVQDLPGSKHDLYELVHRLETEGRPKPWVFQSCGVEDFLYEDNQRFKNFMGNQDFVYEYHEGPGAHTWDVWDFWIVHALDFFRRYMKEHGVKENVDPDYKQSVNVVV